MKQKLKNFLKFTMLFLVISLFINCEKEEDIFIENKNVSKQSDLSLRKVYEKEIKENFSVLEELKRLTKQKVTENGAQNKFVSSNGYNFHVKTSEAIYVENGNYNSYTFSIYRENSEDLIENLFLSLQNDGTYKASIIQYGIDEDGNISESTFYNAIALDDDFDSDGVINELSRDGGCVFDYATALGDDNIEYATTAACEAVNGPDGCDRIVIHYVHNACPNVIASVPGSSNGDTSGNTSDGGNTSGTTSGSGSPNTGGTLGTNIDFNSNSSGDSNDSGDSSLPSGGGNTSTTTDTNNTTGTGITTTVGNNAYSIVKTLEKAGITLTEDQKAWLYIFADPAVVDRLRDYLVVNPNEEELVKNLTNIGHDDSIKEILRFIEDNPTPEGLSAAKITAALASTSNLTNFFSSEYEEILLENLPPNSGLIGLLLKYQEHVVNEMLTIIMTEYEDGHQFTTFEIIKIALRAQKETIHLGLDVAGMTPGAGIVFDVINGSIYLVEMDWQNATLSLGAAVPVVGQWVTGSKLAKKVIVLANGKKVFLKAYNLVDGTIKFSNRGQLRKVLGITNSAKHAHHLIPYGQANNLLVQAAAKSNSVWHINDIYNGIEMASDLHLAGHSNYTTAISNKLNELYQGLDNPNNYDEAYTVLSNFCSALKNQMSNLPNNTSGDFVNFINNYIP